MDITISLEQRHVDALCTNYRCPEKTEKQSDDEYAAAKTYFATAKIVEFIDTHARDCDLLCEEKKAREAALGKIKDMPKPSIKR